ncbi:MAG: molybdopterin molybdenumtransferase MoeA, partial [Candidatus Adiutrix sp.]|nr:molybdopterin molybdenumtransferase MoeA [Candidatus Adiutrix sp.]
ENINYVRADTGDDFDDRFDAVIPIEDMFLDENGLLRLTEGLTVEPGQNINPRGTDMREGDLLVDKGLPIRSFDLAILAVGGIIAVEVVKKPVVSFIPSGNELIPAGRTPGRGQNIDANSLMTKHMLREMGAEFRGRPIIRDDPAELGRNLDEALQISDIVILNAGSSKGLEDYNARLLAEKGRLICHGVLAAPGRPICIAVIDGKPVINTSGPIIAEYYALDWCLRAVIARFLGITARRPRTVSARLTQDLYAPSSLEFLYKMRVRRAGDGYEVEPLTFGRVKGVDLKGFSSGQFITELGRDLYPAGSLIDVELLYDLEL